MKLLKSYTDKQIAAIIKQQNYLKSIADIYYQCYVEKIELEDFWNKWLWNFTSKLNNVSLNKVLC